MNYSFSSTIYNYYLQSKTNDLLTVDWKINHFYETMVTVLIPFPIAIHLIISQKSTQTVKSYNECIIFASFGLLNIILQAFWYIGLISSKSIAVL